MNYSSPRQCTVKKYTTYLKSMIIKIKKEGDLFSQSKFREDNPLPNNWFKYCEQLQYIISHGEGKGRVYHAILNVDEITDFHGSQIAKISLGYNIKHNDQYVDNDSRIITTDDKKKEKTKVQFNIQSISIEELLKELKRRGYSGEITKSIII